jgi:hypothetical protein
VPRQSEDVNLEKSRSGSKLLGIGACTRSRLGSNAKRPLYWAVRLLEETPSDRAFVLMNRRMLARSEGRVASRGPGFDVVVCSRWRRMYTS